MATGATAQWWVRNDGNDANGGGYDSGLSGAATNYSDQASAQASWTGNGSTTGLSFNGTATVTDAGSTGLFTSAMIGNAIQISGKGYYWITAFTNSNTVTVALGTGATSSSFTGVSAKLGGAFRNPSNMSTGGSGSISPTSATALAPGNTINIRASGSGSVGSPDYTQSGYALYPAGDTTSGYVAWVPYNGTPYLSGNGLTIYSTNFHKFSGIYFTTSSNSLGSLFGMIFAPNAVFIGCTIDANNQAIGGLGGSSNDETSSLIIDCEIKGGGTTSLNGINAGVNAVMVKNCKIHGWGGWGVVETETSSGVRLISSAVYGNGGGGSGGGVSLETTATVYSVVDGCTIDSNTGPGIKIASTAAAGWAELVNNNLTNNSTYGIDVASGSAATNTQTIGYEDYNNVHGNTTASYHNLNAGAHDISLDPGYASAGSGDFTPSNASTKAAAPIGFGTSGLYIGAVQPSSSGAAGILYVPNLEGT